MEETELGKNDERVDIFERELDRNAANFVPLSPLSFLKRAADIYPDKVAVIHGDRRHTYREFYERCRRLASALAQRGVGVGDTVAVIAPNVPELLEAHYGVPMLGAVLNAINTRLDAEAVAFVLQHGEAKVVITDKELSGMVGSALDLLEKRPLVIDIDDPMAGGGALLGETDYEAFLRNGDPDFAWQLPEDEWQAIALNYTSGTAGNPKGVVYSHRGAYLNALGNALAFGVELDSRSISGPCPCSIAAAGAIPGPCRRWPAPMSACARSIRAVIYPLIAEHKVTHLCAAPIVLNMLCQRAGFGENPVRPCRRGRDRRRGAAQRHHRGDGTRRLPRHPSVRADGELWSFAPVRLAGRLGRARPRRQGREDGAARRAGSSRRKTLSWPTRRRCSRSRPTDRPWARSCCAATPS